MRHNILLLAVLIFSMKIFSFDEGFADNNSINIAYRDYGPENAKPILLVTGLGAQLTLWPEFLIKDLQANNFRPIVFDNRDYQILSV